MLCVWSRFASIAVLACCASGCGTFIEYTDALRKSEDYSQVVRGTAQVGGLAGLLVSIPVDIGVLPVSVPVYLYQRSADPEGVDLSDSVLFPSFALLGVGSLLAVPVDVLEYAFYRAWRAPKTRTAEEQEDIERRLDDSTLPRYPVTPIYPIQRTGDAKR